MGLIKVHKKFQKGLKIRGKGSIKEDINAIIWMQIFFACIKLKIMPNVLIE